MKNQILLVLLFTVLFFQACHDDENFESNVQIEAVVSFDDIDVTQGISQYFSQEEISEFELDDLDEIDEFLRNKVDRNSTTFKSHAVTLAEGSEDGLQDAINAAGPGGTVFVRSGMHTESGTVTISDPVTVVGEDGATLVFDVDPSTTEFAQISNEVALYIYKTRRVSIINLHLESLSDPGGTAILIESSAKCWIYNNTITNFGLGILINTFTKSYIIRNTISTSLAWTTGEIADAYDITVINGPHTRIIANTAMNGVFGIWACDANGLLTRNKTNGNFIGQILCKVPEGSFVLPSGKEVGSSKPCTHWMARYNWSSENFDAGYLVIDGANRNNLIHNFAENNAT